MLSKLGKRLAVIALTAMSVLTLTFNAFANPDSADSGGASTIVDNVYSITGNTYAEKLSCVVGKLAAWDGQADLLLANQQTISQIKSDWLSGNGFQGRDNTNFAAENKKDVTFAGKHRYYDLKDEEGALKNDFLKFEGAYNTIIGNGSAKSTTQVKNELNTALDNWAITPNLTETTRALAGFQRLISLATGTLVMIVILMMAFFTAMDIAYLVFPIAKEKMDSAGQSGHKLTSSQNKSTGESKFRWVTDDATNAWNEASETGANAVFLYLKKRLISYIAIAVVLFILMTGNLAVIINGILGVLTTVFDALSKATGA